MAIMWIQLGFVWGAIIACAGETMDSKVVQISQGLVLGYRQPEFDVFAFYGIPYATAPERFMAPIAPPSWNHTYEAVDRGIICPQPIVPDLSLVNKTMQEDCLLANIFVPNTEISNLPVLVNFHGGAYELGYGTLHNFKTMSRDKNIVIVTFNYRIGVLGFLCLGTEGAPGNAGLKDQLALLRWVKQNIASFGGNPNDITLSGCSAGSSSIDILTLSKTTRGLFNRAICDSGAHLSVFSVQGNPIQNAKDAARMLNYDNVDDLSSLQQFFKNAPVDLLTSRPFLNNKNSGLYFSPCVEKDLGEEAVLLDAPYNILKNGEYVRYPTMYGFTTMEGMTHLGLFDTWKDEMNDKFSDFLPEDLNFENEQQKETVAQAVKEFYFGEEPVSEATILSFVEYFTDVFFVYGMMKSVKAHAEAGNFTFYLHEYSFVDDNTPTIPFTDVMGADHCTQAFAVQDEDLPSITDDYLNMKSIMRELWTNFILTGAPVQDNSPVPTWPPTGGDRSPHLSLGRTIQLKGTPVEARARFWDAIYERHYRAPIPPSTDSASTIKKDYLIYLLIATFSLLRT